MPELVYVLCALTSVLCAGLLLRSYRANRTRLLLWSTLCFVGLAINNILLFVDIVLVPGVDLRFLRSGSALIALVLLTIGLVWESR
jgi:hydrogenase/urease accessory protein HupE